MKLPFVVGTFNIHSIFGSETLSNIALQAIGVEKDQNGNDFVYGQRQKVDSDRLFVKSPCNLFYGTQVT